jgi:WD40 repeat protein
MTKVCVKRSSPPIPSGLGRELVEILQKCFAFESSERPSAMEVLKAVKREVGTSMAIEDQFSANLDSLTWLSSTDGSTNYSTSKCNPFTARELGQRNSSNVISPHTSSYIENCDGNVDTRESNASSQPHTGTSFTQEYDGNCDLGSNNNSIKPTVTDQSLAEDHEDFNIVHIGTLVEEHTGHQGTGLKVYCIEVANDGTLYVLLRRNNSEGTSLLMFSKNKYVGKLSWASNIWYAPSKFMASGPEDMLYAGAENKVSGGGSKVLYVWKQNKFLRLHNQKRKGSYCCLIVSPSTGTLYCGSKDGTIDVWDSNLRFMAQLSGNPGFPVDLLAIDHNDTLFSSSSAKHKGVADRTVWVWRNQVNVTILAITVPVRSLACAPTGMLYVGTAEGKIKVYNDLEYITEYNCGVRTMAVQADALFIETSSISVMNIQAWRNHKCIAQGNKLGANSHVEQLRCSTTKDGTYLYSASNHGSIVVSRSNVDVWKVESKN